MAKQANAPVGSIHPGRPKDEESHIKQYNKNKKEIIEYIVNVDLKEIGIEESYFKDLQALFQLFDLGKLQNSHNNQIIDEFINKNICILMTSKDQDGVLSLQEFVRVLRALGKPCKLFKLATPKIVLNIFYLEMTKTARYGQRKKYQLTKPTIVSLSMNSSLSTENIKRRRRTHLSSYWNVLKCSTPRRREPSRRLSSGGL